MGIVFAQIVTYTNINTSTRKQLLTRPGLPLPILPFVVKIILLAPKTQGSPLLEEAGLVFQENPRRRFFQINLLMGYPRPFWQVVGWGIALSMGEFAATLMVIPPGMSTLSMRIYNYLHDGASSIR